MTRTRRASCAVAALSAAALSATSAQAADLPQIKASADNAVMACATPGRLMAYLRERNAAMDTRYDGLATEYMRHGEALGIRWDYAFFQMLLETGYLRYGGDVKPEQNNFAGLGATGRGARGESFHDISAGARAHLEHLLVYSGTPVESPTAQRTRMIQDEKILAGWQAGFSQPITFTDMAKKWAPGSRGYVRDVTTIAQRFIDGACNQPDPRPELVAEARGQTGQAAVAAATDPAPEGKGAEIAKRAVEEARAEGNVTRAALGAGSLAKAVAEPAAPSQPSPPLTILNAEVAKVPAETAPAAAAPVIETAAVATTAVAVTAKAVTKTAPIEKPAVVETAAVTTAAAATAVKDAAGKASPAAGSGSGSSGKCKVWTASYGGSKAIIIKAVADKTVNYTVLDVNEGAEKRESDAYISAYAKGGERVGDFVSPSQALDRAFELCPEG